MRYSDSICMTMCFIVQNPLKMVNSRAIFFSQLAFITHSHSDSRFSKQRIEITDFKQATIFSMALLKLLTKTKSSEHFLQCLIAPTIRHAFYFITHAILNQFASAWWTSSSYNNVGNGRVRTHRCSTLKMVIWLPKIYRHSRSRKKKQMLCLRTGGWCAHRQICDQSFYSGYLCVHKIPIT